MVRILAITVAGFALIFSFQNCGKGFQSQQSLATLGSTTQNNDSGDVSTLPVIEVPMTALKFKKAVAGNVHVCLIKNDETAGCMGTNQYGQLGNNLVLESEKLIQVTGLSSVKDLDAGASHTCAIAAPNNSVWCWGFNDDGQLGDGTTTSSAIPLMVPGITGAKAVAAGQHHSCVVTSNDSVKCWGSNMYSELGNDSKTNSFVPVDVVSLSNVKKMTSGGRTTCVLTESNEVMCWGRSVSRTQIPYKVPNMMNVVSLSNSWENVCALTTDNKVFCNLGNTVTNEVPNVRGAKKLSVGGFAFNNCVIMGDDSVRCWENKSVDGALVPQAAVDVVGMTDIDSLVLSKSDFFSCAMSQENVLKCFSSIYFPLETSPPVLSPSIVDLFKL